MLSCRINSLSRVVSGWNTGTHSWRRVGAVRFALSCYTHEPRRAHKTNIPNSHILPPTTGLQLFLMWQEGAGDEGGWARGGEGAGGEWRGIACEGLIQCFSPRWVTSVAHNQQICFCQVYTLLNVWRGKKGGWGGYMRDGEMSSPAPKNAYFNCPSQLIIINDWGSFFHWVEVESRNKSRRGEMKWKALRWLQTWMKKSILEGPKHFCPPCRHGSEARRTPDARLWKFGNVLSEGDSYQLVRTIQETKKIWASRA